MKKLFYIIGILGILTLPANSQESLINDQANMLYAENRIEEAFNLLLTIPSEMRTPQNWLLLGNILHDKNKDDDAEFMYNQAIVSDLKFYKAAYNLGNLYLYEEKPNMAIEQYKNVIKLKPDFAYAYYNMGCAYLKLGKLKEAKKYFMQAVELKPTEADFHYNLAYTLKKMNKTKDAQLYLDYYNKIKENSI